MNCDFFVRQLRLFRKQLRLFRKISGGFATITLRLSFCFVVFLYICTYKTTKTTHNVSSIKMVAMSEKKKDIALCQDNVLTESRYNFNRIEKNCLYKIIEQVRNEYVEGSAKENGGIQNMFVTIQQEVLEQITDKTHKKDAHDALIKLRKRDIEIWKEDGSWFNCGFVNWCEYDANTKSYKVEVSYRIMPYLVELARQYTTYSLTVAITLKSVYSQRFYELCCQYRNRIENDGLAGFHKTQQQLREMFCLEDKYPNSNDFNKRVIKKAQDELKASYDEKQCDLYFDVNIKGRGSEMCYDFKIHTREQSERQKQVFEDCRKKWIYIQQELLSIYKRDPKFVQRVMKQLDFHPNLIDPVLGKLMKAKQELKGADLAKLLRFILKEDFNLD